MKNLVRLLRPHQYVKNGFVFLGVIFGPHEAAFAVNALIAFLAFCAISSCIYVMNDILDVEVDRGHPVKCTRPLASGAVGIHTARWLSLAMLVLAIALGGWAGWQVLGIVLAYGLLNVGYSKIWKHVAVLDVFVISAGFMLRILAGTVGIGISPSSWLLLCGMMITLFLGFAKRGAELKLVERRHTDRRGTTRQVLGQYEPAMVEQFMAISAACAILSYSLYTVNAETIARHGTDRLIYTVPFVVYGVFRYVYLVHRREGGSDAAQDIFTDRHLIATLAGWLIVTFAILW